jgi:C4-type Zn-finger protein
VSGTPQPQTIIINIKEDDKVIKTLTKSGTASIYINNGDISASLPSATKYK